MDINTIASEIIRTSYGNKDAKELMPKQQARRAYKSLEKSTQVIKINPTLMIQFVGESRGEWILQYRLQWPMGPIGHESRNNSTTRDIEEFAKEWALNRSFSHLGDNKYIKIKKATKDVVTYVFDVDEWIKRNFSTTRPHLVGPTTLHFRYRDNPPTFFTTNAPYMDLEKFCGTKFKEYMKNKTTKLKHKEFAFIKRMSADLFEYEMDMQKSVIKASLKYSVIMASLAGYMLYKHNKEFDRREIKNIQNRTRNLGSIKRLDKYLKGL